MASRVAAERTTAEWGPLAYAVAGFILGASRILAWLAFEPGPALAGLFDAGQFVAVGFLVGVLALLWSLMPGRVLRRTPAWLLWTALSALATLLGVWVLPDDLDSFSRRQTALPQNLVHFSAVLALSQTLVVAVVLGQIFDRPHLRWMLVAGAIALCVGNGLALPGDYLGLHLFAAAGALVSSGTALRGARGRPPRLSPTPPLLAGLLASVASGFVPIEANLATALHNSTGAAFSRLFAWHRHIARPRTPQGAILHPEWFHPRDELPPVPASYGSLLGEDPIVVFITIDALRSDVLLSGKYDHELPTLARLRDEGVVFTQARVAGTLTKTSLSSLFMGKHFSQQYWSPMKRFNNAMSVHEDDSVRFTEILSDANVHTANFRSVSWLRNGVVMRGFDHEEHVEYPPRKSYYTPSPPVFKRLLPYLKKRLKKEHGAFIYSHLSDAHAPYDQGKLKKGTPFDRYLSEVALVDSQLKKLVRVLTKHRKSGGKKTLLILSADHGEAFGEHNSQTHGTTLYDEGLHVPLLFWVPGGTAAKVATPVSLLDLGPTVLDLFGLETPGTYMGESLAAFLAGEKATLTRPVIAETRLMQTLVTPELMKVIVDTRSSRIELYDLRTDPYELRNLADDADRVQGPLGTLSAFFEAHTLTRNGYRPPLVR